jgi:ribosomal protein S18 acetylase RimI-like enzyme
MTDWSQGLDLSRLEISDIRTKECVARFRCGERQIDDWASSKAYKYHQQDRSRVFCCRLRGQSTVLGLFSVSLNMVGADFLFERHEDRYSSGYAPFIYLEWFAVLRSCQSQGIGKIMMMNALRRAYLVSLHVPFYGLALRSLNEKTTAFYERQGFVKRTDDRHPLMILPVWTIRDLFERKN